MQDCCRKQISRRLLFFNMHHCHASLELGVNRAALRRHLCNCMSCDEVISRSWMHGVEDPADQPRFVNAEGCPFRSFFGDENMWHFLELQEKVGSYPEELDEEKLFSDIRLNSVHRARY